MGPVKHRISKLSAHKSTEKAVCEVRLQRLPLGDQTNISNLQHSVSVKSLHNSTDLPSRKLDDPQTLEHFKNTMVKNYGKVVRTRSGRLATGISHLLLSKTEINKTKSKVNKNQLLKQLKQDGAKNSANVVLKPAVRSAQKKTENSESDIRQNRSKSTALQNSKNEKSSAESNKALKSNNNQTATVISTEAKKNDKKKTIKGNKHENTSNIISKTNSKQPSISKELRSKKLNDSSTELTEDFINNIKKNEKVTKLVSDKNVTNSQSKTNDKKKTVKGNKHENTSNIISKANSKKPSISKELRSKKLNDSLTELTEDFIDNIKKNEKVIKLVSDKNVTNSQSETNDNKNVSGSKSNVINKTKSKKSVVSKELKSKKLYDSLGKLTDGFTDNIKKNEEVMKIVIDENATNSRSKTNDDKTEKNNKLENTSNVVSKTKSKKPLVLLTNVEKNKKIIKSVDVSAMKSPTVQNNIKFFTNRGHRNLSITQDVPLLSKKLLRKRRTRNYAELSFENSPKINDKKGQVLNQTTRHIPVYLQTLEDDKETNQNDLYEFQSETPPEKPFKAKKRGKKKFNESDSDYDKYEKSIHEILKKVRKKMDQRKKQITFETNKNEHHQDDLLQVKKGIVNSKNLKSDNCAHLTKPSNTNQAPDINLYKHKNNNYKKGSKLKFIPTVSSNLNIDQKQRKNLVPTNKDANLPEDDPMDDAFETGGDDFCYDYDDLEFQGISKNQAVILSDKFKSINSEQQSTKRVNIISNVLFSSNEMNISSTSIASTDAFDRLNMTNNFNANVTNTSVLKTPRRPNDTELNMSVLSSTVNHSSAQCASPWRLDTSYMKYNPHFLSVKSTCLPNYNQEMVLDASIVEKSLMYAPKVPKNVNVNSKNMAQSSILDFVSDKVTTRRNDPVDHNISLFDYESLSPIKVRNKTGRNSPKKSYGPSNIKLLKKTNFMSTPLQTNNQQNIVSSNPVPDLIDEQDGDSYFGFANDENDKENENKIKDIDNRGVLARPIRIPVKETKKVLFAMDTGPEVDEDVNVETVNTTEVGSFPSPVPDTEDVQIRLFEDLDETKPSRRSYERKRPKRQRLPSVDSEKSDNTVVKPRRKRKDARTKAEEREYENWAAAFNSMCKEVDGYNLEVV